MKVLFDTSVWVEHLRRGVLDELFPAMRHGWLLLLDATVAAELVAGCRSKRERQTVDRLKTPFLKAGRLIVPEQADFQRAASALSRLRERGKHLANPGAALLDGLIAAAAVRVGALVVTLNDDDFAKLSEEMPLVFRNLAGFSAAIAT